MTGIRKDYHSRYSNLVDIRGSEEVKRHLIVLALVIRLIE